jgi:hypothetical protein
VLDGNLSHCYTSSATVKKNELIVRPLCSNHSTRVFSAYDRGFTLSRKGNSGQCEGKFYAMMSANPKKNATEKTDP